MGKLYVAHEVEAKYIFKGHAYYRDLLGCEYNVIYDVKREYVVLEQNENGEYFYLGAGNERAVVVDYNNMDTDKVQTHIEDCHYCLKRHIMRGSDCTLVKEMEDKIIGVIDIQEMKELTGTEDINESFKFISEYNNALQNQKKRVRKINS